MYKPLPNSLTIKQSGIDGLGLFAKEGIAQGTNLGMSHVLIGSGIVRTPMGGFINHSNEMPTSSRLSLELMAMMIHSLKLPQRNGILLL